MSRGVWAASVLERAWLPIVIVADAAAVSDAFHFTRPKSVRNEQQS